MRHPNILVSTLLAGLTLTITACVPLDPNQAPREIKTALPTADSVRVNVPENAQSFQALGDLADYYVVTRTLSRDLNGGAGWVLLLANTIVQFPPTTVEGDVYTWGPHSEALDPAEWRMVVTERDDGSYDWRFDGRSKIDGAVEFTTIIDGNAIPGAEPHRGSGTFAIDFDAAERVNPIDNDARGRVEIAYDLENTDGTAATLAMVIETVEIGDDGVERAVSFDYAYAENRDGSGDLQFGIHGDLDANGSLSEDALIRSRWLSDGAGRADILLSGGDLGELSVAASECWDVQFRRVYYTDSAEWAPTEGDVASCVFADQDLPNL